MPDLSLDLRYLRCALAVSEQGSFRRAASKLELPQSTVSRRVQLLERRLGFALFVPDRRGARLTVSGAGFLKDAMAGAKQIARAAQIAAAAQRGESGEIRNKLLSYGRKEPSQLAASLIMQAPD
jgi:DNA-binding transcriptional LysR family regulator